MNLTPHDVDFRPDLQGLRALAVTLVVLAHANVPGLAGGFVGVDIFFVLSGFLISRLLLREHYAKGRIDYLAFVARRLRRLLPALLVMLAVSLSLARLLLTPHEFLEQTASVVFAATWTSNLFFSFTTFDYFNELHQRDLFLHTWSLGVEEQFYLVWPLLIAGLLMMLGRGHNVVRKRLVLGAVIGVFAASLALCLYWSSVNTMWAFYLMPARIWQFTLGAMVFVFFGDSVNTVLVRRLTLPDSLRVAFLLGGTGMILASAVIISPRHIYPGAWALLPSVGTAAVIIAGCGWPDNAVRRSLLAHPLLVWLGDRSYSLYLWHWPLLMLGFAWGLAEVSSAVLALLALALLLAMASYRWIELPFWKGRMSSAPALRSIAVAATSIVLVSAGLIGLRMVDGAAASGARALVAEARNDATNINGLDCDDWVFSADLNPCIVGEPEAPRTAVLIGDSVGVQWYPALPAIFNGSQWRIVVLTKSACAMVDEDYVYGASGGYYDVCTQWRNDALDYIDSIRPDIVLVGSASSYDFSDQQWVHGSRRILERIAASDADVVVIPGTPLLSFDGPACIERALLSANDDTVGNAATCSEPLAGKQAQHVRPLLASAADASDKVALLDLTDLVCPQGVCAARQSQGPVVYRDMRHLTNSFVTAQRETFRSRLLALDLASLRDMGY